MKRAFGLILFLAVVLIPIFAPAQTAHNITISWTAGSGGGAPTSYIVLRGTTAGSETMLATVPASQTSYVDTSGTGGQQYFYTVQAVNSAGTSASSAEVSVTFLLSPPATPTGLKAVAN